MKIKNIGKVVTGFTPSTKNKQFYINESFPFITPEDLKVVKYIENPKRYISDTVFNEYGSRFINKNSILVDCIGSDLGNVAITKELSLTNQQINTITNIDKTKFDIEFIYYVLCLKKELFKVIGSSSSTIPLINKSTFEEIDLLEVEKSLPTQQHIVDNIRKGSVIA